MVDEISWEQGIVSRDTMVDEEGGWNPNFRDVFLTQAEYIEGITIAGKRIRKPCTSMSASPQPVMRCALRERRVSGPAGRAAAGGPAHRTGESCRTATNHVKTKLRSGRL